MKHVLYVHPERENDAGNWNILVPAGKENKYVIPLLAESEKGGGQAESSGETRIEMWCNIMTKLMNWSFLERNTVEGDSPVDEIDMFGYKRVGRLGLVVWI